MAHMVENMMSVGAAPWHGLGVRLDNPPSAQEAIRLAGLNWQVKLMPVFLADGRETSARATVRNTDGRILGVVGPHYRPLQNNDAFKWFNPFLEAGQARLETAGSLAGGKRVWVLARLAREPLEIAPGDVVEKFLLLSNGHDGCTAVRAGYTPVRVVCQNTLSMSHGADASQLIRLRHTSKTLQSLDAIREVMNLADQTFEATASQYRRLVNRTVCQADLRRYVRLVFTLPEDEAKDTPQQRRLLERIGELFEVGQGNDLPTVRGSWWAAYNGVTQFLGTERGRTAEGRLSSLWFGESAQLNRRALDTALDLAC